jgi:hypothetical protein
VTLRSAWKLVQSNNFFFFFFFFVVGPLVWYVLKSCLKAEITIRWSRCMINQSVTVWHFWKWPFALAFKALCVTLRNSWLFRMWQFVLFNIAFCRDIIKFWLKAEVNSCFILSFILIILSQLRVFCMAT